MRPTLPAPRLFRLGGLLTAHIGLHFPADRWSDLERGIITAAPDFGMPDTILCQQAPAHADHAARNRNPCHASAPHILSHVPVPLTDFLPERWRWARKNMPAENMPATRPSADASHGSAPASAEADRSGRMMRDSVNQGRLGEAAEWCRDAIAADKLNSAHHYLLAAIQQQQGQGEAVVQSLAYALYLDPHFAIDHYASGNLRQAQGRHREAQRHFANALASLQAHPSGKTLPESDGLTAGRLAKSIKSMQRPQHAASL